ncbi:phosphorylase family protein [Mycoplasma sp. 5370]
MITDLTKIKNALIIADPEEEHLLIQEGWNLKKTIKKLNKKFLVFEKNNNFLVVLYSGIGLINAASSTTLLLSVFNNIENIYNFGAVGSISKKHNIFEIVIPKKFFNIDTQTPWYNFGQTPGEKQYFLNKIKIIEKVKYSNICSSNSFLDSKEKALEFYKKTKCEIFDMESFAIAQVCSQNKINFFSVKAISDKISQDVDNKLDINFRIKESSKKAFLFLISNIIEN